jgi:hypothetical protein
VPRDAVATPDIEKDRAFFHIMPTGDEAMIWIKADEQLSE